MTHVKTKATDGSTIEFIMKNPMQGSVKNVYFAPDRSYVVAFDKKQPISPLRRELLEKLSGEYRKQIFEQVGGEYWAERFAWPQKIVEYNGEIGFVVPAYQKHFFFAKGTTLEGAEKEGKWFTSAKNFIDAVPKEEKGELKGYMQVCLNLARAVRRLHAAGLAHSDLSYRNCLVDPKDGRACIIDIDGLVVPKLFPPDVIGTPDFIAPEVLTTLHLPMRSDPNNPNSELNPNRFFPRKETDRHALAVLIYMYLFHRHPLRGGKVWDLDDDKQEKLEMGEKALFIEHPKDATNRVKIKSGSKLLPWVDPSTLPYTMFGPYLKELFEKAFIDGLHDPRLRPTADDWETELVRTFDMIQPCQNKSCVKKWFIFDNTTKPKCPYCGTPYKGALPVLDFYSCFRAGEAHRPDNNRLMVFDGQSLFSWHIDRTVFPNEKLTEEQRRRVGYFQFHGGKWYLVNETMAGMKNQATGQEIPLQGSVELTNGLPLLLKPGVTGRGVSVTIVNG